MHLLLIKVKLKNSAQPDHDQLLTLSLITQSTAKGTDEWHLASKFIGRLDTQRIRYTGVRGQNYEGDIALDDINIVGCDVS